MPIPQANATLFNNIKTTSIQIYVVDSFFVGGKYCTYTRANVTCTVLGYVWIEDFKTRLDSEVWWFTVLTRLSILSAMKIIHLYCTIINILKSENPKLSSIKDNSINFVFRYHESFWVQPSIRKLNVIIFIFYKQGEIC